MAPFSMTLNDLYPGFKVTRNRLSAGLRPRPHWVSLQRSPDPLAALRGPTSNGRGGEGPSPQNSGSRTAPAYMQRCAHFMFD